MTTIKNPGEFPSTLPSQPHHHSVNDGTTAPNKGQLDNNCHVTIVSTPRILRTRCANTTEHSPFSSPRQIKQPTLFNKNVLTAVLILILLILLCLVPTVSAAAVCGNVDGTQSNSPAGTSIDCQCGTMDCTSSTGMYCVAERNTCYQSPLPGCAAISNVNHRCHLQTNIAIERNGVATASSKFAAVHGNTPVGPSEAFNSGLYAHSITNPALPVSLEFQFSSNRTIAAYSVQARNIDPVANYDSPMDWTFDGSNDGLNYTILDCVKNETNWKHREIRSFYINTSNIGRFRFYRLNMWKSLGRSSSSGHTR